MLRTRLTVVLRARSARRKKLPIPGTFFVGLGIAGENIVCMLHYPPITARQDFTEFAHMMAEGGIDICVYGHLHGNGHRTAYEGEKNGTTYRCISSDFIGFKPLLLS